MIGKRYWILLQITATVSSIIGVVVLFVSDVAEAIQLTIVGMVVIAILLSILATIQRRQNVVVRVRRQALIDTGIRLMSGAKRRIIMFGSDMSWATDYESVIRNVTSTGKEVIVLYTESDAPGVLRNASILRDAGAVLIPTSRDSRIRGMLIDPQEPADALLYVAYRRSKPNAAIVKEGEKSSSENFYYFARVYDMKNDWIVIRAITRYFEILSTKHLSDNE